VPYDRGSSGTVPAAAGLLGLKDGSSMNSPAPGWHPDPTSRHQYRYWDGARWTDDVADGGVASTDALGDPPSPSADPSPTPSDPTRQLDPTGQVDPTRQYPIAGEPATSTSPPYYGDYYGTGQPPPAPPRKRPPAGLIAALAVLAVALVGGLVYALVRDDDSNDDGSNDNAAEVSDEDSTTSEPDSSDGDNNGDNNDTSDTSGDNSDTTLPDDIDSENVDQLVELMADEMERSSGGVIDHEEATCISEGLLDELGVERLAEIGESGENPFTDPEATSRLFSIMEDCGVSLEDLAALPD
jgi:hypothetical protein